MDGIIILIMMAAFVLSAIPQKQSSKTVEQELGEAIGKYLGNGIKIQVELNDKKE